MAVAKSTTGLKKETAGALSYLFGPVTGVLFLALEKDNFVRFHAMQSIVVFGGFFILNIILTMTIILALLIPLVMIVSFVLWLFLMYQALQGKEWEVPYMGKIARQLLTKI